MHKHFSSCQLVFVCPSVDMSHSCIVSKLPNISSNFFSTWQPDYSGFLRPYGVTQLQEYPHLRPEIWVEWVKIAIFQQYHVTNPYQFWWSWVTLKGAHNGPSFSTGYIRSHHFTKSYQIWKVTQVGMGTWCPSPVPRGGIPARQSPFVCLHPFTQNEHIQPVNTRG